MSVHEHKKITQPVTLGRLRRLCLHRVATEQTNSTMHQSLDVEEGRLKDHCQYGARAGYSMMRQLTQKQGIDPGSL